MHLRFNHVNLAHLRLRWSLSVLLLTYFGNEPLKMRLVTGWMLFLSNRCFFKSVLLIRPDDRVSTRAVPWDSVKKIKNPHYVTSLTPNGNGVAGIWCEEATKLLSRIK